MRILNSVGGERPNLEIIETPEVFSAVRHLKWALSDSSLQASAENIMLFFHDDRIDSARFDEFAQRHDLAGGVAFFGGWRLSRHGIEHGVSTTQIQVGGESPTAWFTREDLSKETKASYTNASGLIVPMKSIAEYLRWVPLTRGARFEHMLVSHKSVRSLKTVALPFLIVNRHALQEGENIPLIQGLTDEIVFQLWMFLNGRRRSPRAIAHGMAQTALATASLTRRLLFRKTK